MTKNKINQFPSYDEGNINKEPSPKEDLKSKGIDITRFEDNQNLSSENIDNVIQITDAIDS